MSTSMVFIILYLFTRMDALSNVATTLAITMSIALGITVLAYCMWFVVVCETDTDKQREWHKKHQREFLKFIKRMMLPMWIFTIFLHIATPTQKDTMVIVGGALGYHSVHAVVSDTRVRDTSNKAFELMDAWLDQQLMERQLNDDSTPETDNE